MTRYVLFFEPCTGNETLLGHYDSDGKYVSAGGFVDLTEWLTAEQRACIRLIQEALVSGDDPSDISPQVRVEEL